MPRITALRAPRPGRVAVELDGAPWRTLPLEVVVRVGLLVDEELDRPRLRLLRRELRRHETLAAAGRVLRHRDHSARELDRKLAHRGASAAERVSALETLERAGLVDDVRFAAERARILAERGWGDAAVRADLERQGVAAEVVAEAIQALEPERERAARLAARRGGGVRAARWLAARGFDADALEEVIANDRDGALP